MRVSERVSERERVRERERERESQSRVAQTTSVINVFHAFYVILP